MAYGFLCGRDYEGERFVDRDRSGFALLKERRRVFDSVLPAPAAASAAAPAAGPVIGIPAALGLYGQLPLWKGFFAELGVRTLTSEGFTAGIVEGREVQGAEFCAPLAALHGHVRHLQGKVDWIFLPVMLEENGPRGRDPRVYCYYTQFSSALASGTGDPGLREKCLMPQLSWTKWRERTKRELFEAMVHAGVPRVSQESVSAAFEHATAAFEQGERLLQKRFREETANSAEPCVVLLGRPYNVLSPR